MSDTRNDIDAFRRSSLVLSALLVVLYIAARAWRLNASCLWFDEIFGVHAARHTWGGLWSFVAADLIHPPLFYALLKIWVAAGGESLEWLRFFPLLASIACLVPFLLLARGLRLGVFASNLALLLLAAHGYLIKYAQEVRMYSLLLFFTLGSLWLFGRFLNEAGTSRKFPHALMLCNLLLVYTHYYGWLVVGAQAAFLLVKDRGKLKAFLPGAAALVVCFAPWVYACATAAAAAAGEGGGLAQNIGWIERPGPSQLAQFYALLQEPSTPAKLARAALRTLGSLCGLPPARTALALLLCASEKALCAAVRQLTTTRRRLTAARRRMKARRLTTARRCTSCSSSLFSPLLSPSSRATCCRTPSGARVTSSSPPRPT